VSLFFKKDLKFDEMLYYWIRVEIADTPHQNDGPILQGYQALKPDRCKKRGYW